MTHLERTIIHMLNTHKKKKVEASRQGNISETALQNKQIEIYQSLINECIIGDTVMNHLLKHHIVVDGIYIDSHNQISLHLSKGENKMTQALCHLRNLADIESASRGSHLKGMVHK